VGVTGHATVLEVSSIYAKPFSKPLPVEALNWYLAQALGENFSNA
jgi:hypothetical protein